MITWERMASSQPIASQILVNSFKNDRLSHAYLIQGPRGTGKRSFAQLIAQTLFCEQRTDIEPCQTCSACKRIRTKNFPDVHWLERDGQSIKKEQVDQLQEEFTYRGFESIGKVYIIEDAQTLTVNASNRILKFLEEPQTNTTAILLTENSQAIIPTIRSRCQIIDLQPLQRKDFQKSLQKNGLDEQSARLLSVFTNDLGEAIELNEDEWFAEARRKMLQLIRIYITNPDDAFLFLHEEWLTHFKKRHEQERGLDLLIFAFRDILYFHMDYTEAMAIFSEKDALLKEAMLTFSYKRLVHILNTLLEAKQKLGQNVHPTLVMEQLTLQI